MADRFPEWMKLPDAVSTRKRSNSRRRRKQSLNVTFSNRLMSSFKDVSVQVIVASLAVALALCVGLFFAVRSAADMLFAQNAMFTIQNVEFETTDRVAKDYVRGKLRIDRGANLFGVNIGKARSDFLQFAPHYRAMAITRVLPDTMRIELIEREPIAHFGLKGSYAVDGHGYLFRPRRGSSVLPTISGYNGEVLRPGDRLSGLAADAVALIDYARQADFDQDLGITSIDVTGGFAGRKESIRLHLKAGCTVDFWWNRNSGDSVTQDLHDRLAFLRSEVRRAQSEGKKLEHVNLTLDAYRRNLPIVIQE